MSQIATFYVVDPTVSLDSLEAAVKPTAVSLTRILRFGKKPEPKPMADPRVISSRDLGSNGYVITVLAEFLREHDRIDVLVNDDVSLEQAIVRSDAVTFSYTPTRSAELVRRLAESIPNRDTLTDYWREFDETDEPEAGHWMLVAHEWLHDALLPRTVDVLSIG